MPETQAVILESYYTPVAPSAQINPFDGPIDFHIPTATDLFLSPGDIKLYVKGTVKALSGAAISADHEVHPENNFLHTLFSKVEVFLNDSTTSVGTCHYAYRAYIENLLNYDKDAKQTVLKTEGFYTEDEWTDRTFAFEASSPKTFELYGNLHTDITLQSKLLMSGVDVKIRLTRSKPQFYLHADTDGAATSPYFNIEDIYLYIRRVKVNNEVFLNVDKELSRDTAKYPLDRVETKILTIERGISNKQFDNLFLGNLPRRVIIGLLDHAGTDGVYGKKPLEFKPYDLTSINAFVNGMPVGKEYNCKFETVATRHTRCARAFASLYNVATPKGMGHGISLEDYAKNGYTLFCFDLSPDANPDGCDYLNPIQTGTFSISMTFGTPTTDALNLFVYAEHTGLIEIDKTRSIINNV
ncbi:unnamed protein product [Rotaria socialis]|uniref:Uncharacterized protein n=1 Tax=Rotaria socialis TaxID=392032 RepID=A0A818ZI25_9BILA|nr:unnamed protein product [Rotaria socialis]CAF4814640.1 unnamed protein product [Rotaria socialis]